MYVIVSKANELYYFKLLILKQWGGLTKTIEAGPLAKWILVNKIKRIRFTLYSIMCEGNKENKENDFASIWLIGWNKPTPQDVACKRRGNILTFSECFILKSHWK